MPDIARLDEGGLLVAVETVEADEHATDLARRKVALPDNHDMRRHLRAYRWDVLRGHFIPLSMEPLAEAERETPELVEGIVEAIEDLYEKVAGKEPAGRFALLGEGASEQTADLAHCRSALSGRSRSSVPRRAAPQAGQHHLGQPAGGGAHRRGRGQHPRQPHRRTDKGNEP